MPYRGEGTVEAALGHREEIEDVGDVEDADAAFLPRVEEVQTRALRRGVAVLPSLAQDQGNHFVPVPPADAQSRREAQAQVVLAEVAGASLGDVAEERYHRPGAASDLGRGERLV